jgi:YegS/Rv2252/BmrU family lipid kinase
MGPEHGEDPLHHASARALGRVVAVINPVSGAGLDPTAATSRAALVRDTLQRAGHSATIHVTEGAGHARELAGAAARGGADLVIVWGGDGTVNEAGSALVATDTALALVPAGSGNGLAASLGVPRSPAAALQHALAAPPRRIDVGMLAGRAFFNIAGVGLDAHIAGCFNLRERGRRGKWPYVAIGVREGVRYLAQDYQIELDGDRRQLSALLIAFANGREYGMGACLSPGALLDDGLLEATVVEDRSVLARFVDARHLVTRSVARAPRVLVRQIRSARLRCQQPMQYHVDGEPGVAHGSIDVGIVAAGLWVRA